MPLMFSGRSIIVLSMRRSSPVVPDGTSRPAFAHAALALRGLGASRSDEHVILTLGEHDFVNDREMMFEQYPYHIGIRAIGARNEDDRTAWRDRLVNQLYKKLKDKNRYRLLLVED